MTTDDDPDDHEESTSTSNSDRQPVPDHVVRGLTRHATRLRGTAPDGPQTDLDPLRDRLADARIVGLGEASHGSREFFQCKHRLFRYLVTELDARAFTLEASLPEVRAIDRYVRSEPAATADESGDEPRDGEATSDGTASDGETSQRVTTDAPTTAGDALRELHIWPWKAASVRRLIEWLRSYNAGRPAAEQVRVYGFDSQYTTGAVAELTAFFERADPTALSEYDEQLQRVDDDGTPAVRDERRAERIAAIESVVEPLRDLLDANENRYADRTSPAAVERARRDLTVLRGAGDYRECYEEGSVTGSDVDPDALERAIRVRDRRMADNVEWITDRTDGQVVCWAHDAHLNREMHRIRGRDVAAPSAGSWLAETYGDDYLAVGFSAGRLGFRAMGPGEDGWELRDWAVEPPAGTIDAALDRGLDGDAPAVVDCRAASRELDWLTEPQPHYSVGATYEPGDPSEYLTEYAYREAFDLLCHVPVTQPARPLSE